MVARAKPLRSALSQKSVSDPAPSEASGTVKSTS